LNSTRFVRLLKFIKNISIFVILIVLKSKLNKIQLLFYSLLLVSMKFVII